MFDPEAFTAAHKYLPWDTYVRVTNLDNNRSLIVRINDRGPFLKNRVIDLSPAAARELGFYRQGTARVVIQTIPGYNHHALAQAGH
jgi:rare lipoprotein A